MTPDGARELLESTHQFPCSYTIKAIGWAHEDFVVRIVAAAAEGLGRPESVQHRVRRTPHGRHLCVTLEVTVLSADEVIRLYEAVRVVEGIKLLL